MKERRGFSGSKIESDPTGFLRGEARQKKCEKCQKMRENTKEIEVPSS